MVAAPNVFAMMSSALLLLKSSCFFFCFAFFSCLSCCTFALDFVQCLFSFFFLGTSSLPPAFLSPSFPISFLFVIPSLLFFPSISLQIAWCAGLHTFCHRIHCRWHCVAKSPCGISNVGLSQTTTALQHTVASLHRNYFFL